MYAATYDALRLLYPRLAPGGYVLFDDWTLKYSMQAIVDYRRSRGIDATTRFLSGTDDDMAYWVKPSGRPRPSASARFTMQQSPLTPFPAGTAAGEVRGGMSGEEQAATKLQAATRARLARHRQNHNHKTKTDTTTTVSPRGKSAHCESRQVSKKYN